MALCRPVAAPFVLLDVIAGTRRRNARKGPSFPVFTGSESATGTVKFSRVLETSSFREEQGVWGGVWGLGASFPLVGVRMHRFVVCSASPGDLSVVRFAFVRLCDGVKCFEKPMGITPLKKWVCVDCLSSCVTTAFRLMAPRVFASVGFPLSRGERSAFPGWVGSVIEASVGVSRRRDCGIGGASGFAGNGFALVGGAEVK